LALEPDQIYALILDQVHRVLPYDHASVLLYHDGWAIVIGSQGRVSVPVGTRVFALANIDSVAAFGSEGKPVRISDTTDLPNWVEVPPFTAAQRIRSVIVVPLVVAGTTVGTFAVDSFTPNFYTTRHLGVAVKFAERILQALRNAQLFAAEHAARARAEQLAALQNDFVASVSHELRTPLTSIIGFAELLQARWDHLSDAKRLERVGSIVQAANRQQRLVEDLLLSSRLESANLVPKREIVSVAALVRQAVEEVRGSYPGQDIDLVGPSDLLVHTDAARTIQVLTNLIDNAAKYSPEGSPIRVRWTRRKGFAVLRVDDHGPGVPEGGRDKLFARFGRMPGSAIRSGRVGTGLGLHISRGLAEVMGGSLDLETTGPDGSTFRLRLPAIAC
jgi:signal transduction histidine kinase